MAGDVKAEILDSNGNRQSILGYELIRYGAEMNGVGSFNITFPSSTSVDLKKYPTYELVNDNGVEQGLVMFYKGGVLEFKGKVEKINYDTYGRLVLGGQGTGVFLKHQNTTDASRSAETGEVRLRYIMETPAATKVTYTPTTATFNTAGDFAARVYKAGNKLDMIYDLVCLQDNGNFKFTYNEGSAVDNLIVSALLGSSTSIATLTRGKDYKSTYREYDESNILNDVTIYGVRASDGTQASGNATNPTSITKYGTRSPPEPMVDKSCTTDAACEAKAQQIVDNRAYPTAVVTISGILNVDRFIFSNSGTSLGDVITINDPQADIDYALLRIVSYTRTIDKGRNETLGLKTITEGIQYVSTSNIRGDTITTVIDGGKVLGDAQTTYQNTQGTNSNEGGGGALSMGYATSVSETVNASSYKLLGSITFGNYNTGHSIVTADIAISDEADIDPGHHLDFCLSELSTGFTFGVSDMRSSVDRHWLYPHTHPFSGSFGEHNHTTDVSLSLGNHNHTTSVSLTIGNHRHTIGAHTHGVSIVASSEGAHTHGGAVSSDGVHDHTVSGTSNFSAAGNTGYYDFGTPGGTFTSNNYNYGTPGGTFTSANASVSGSGNTGYQSTYWMRVVLLSGTNWYGKTLYLWVYNDNSAALDLSGNFMFCGLGLHTHTINMSNPNHSTDNGTLYI